MEFFHWSIPAEKFLNVYQVSDIFNEFPEVLTPEIFEKIQIRKHINILKIKKIGEI